MSSPVQYPWAAVPHALSDPMALRTAPRNACLKHIESGRNWTEMEEGMHQLASSRNRKEGGVQLYRNTSVCLLSCSGNSPAPSSYRSPSSDRLPWEGSSLQLQPVLDIFQALDKRNSYLVCSLLSTASMPAIPQYFAKCHFCACISASQGLEGFAFSLPLASLLLQDKNLSL